jgi:hypothetical protein
MKRCFDAGLKAGGRGRNSTQLAAALTLRKAARAISEGTVGLSRYKIVRRPRPNDASSSATLFIALLQTS